MNVKTLFGTGLLFAAVITATGARANTYYVDYVNGNDSNSGTSTATPWKHAPGMKGLTPSGSSTGDGCASNCASYSPAAGDEIILRGGIVWPYTTMPWAFTWSGTSSTQTYGCAGGGCIYIGNAVGAGLAAWNSGTVTSIITTRDLGGWKPSSPPTISCTGGGGSGAAATPHVVPAAQTDTNIAGFLYHESLTATGSSYTSAPTCTLSGSGTAALVADINRAIVDLGATQGSPPDWPIGQYGNFPTTYQPGLTVTGNYVLVSGIELRNALVQQPTFGGLNDLNEALLNLQGANDTASNMYVHGMQVDCYSAGSCSEYDVSFPAVGPQSPFDEVANSFIENGDFGFVGNSTQSANGICNTNSFCQPFEFGIQTTTQSGAGPVSAHGNKEWMNSWQLRFVGNDATGSAPYLSYGNEGWLTSYLDNYGAHINARYMQIVSPATLISYNNIFHNQVGGTSSQIQCPSGTTFYFFNEVQWGIGTGTQPYSADIADTGGTGGCTMNLYNDTMYANNGGTCVNSQTGTNATTIVMQNLQCIQTPSTSNPFWGTATNTTFENYSGSTTQVTIQASSVVDIITTATSGGYTVSGLFAPISSSGDTMSFSSNPNSANLTSLCSGNLAALCSDINGNARPTTGGWPAGAYQSSASGTPPGTSSTPPVPPAGLSATVN
jgi:hypothetical protein